MDNEKFIKIVSIVLVILTTILITFTIMQYNIKRKYKNDETNEVLKNTGIINNEIININENSNNIENNESIDYEPENLIGVLKIPKLNIEAEIMEGTDDKVLANYIGHFQNTSEWNGNVALASHNNGTGVAHYFESINQLVEGDEIIYITKLGERRYKVYSIKEISDTDWSITDNSTENILTLMTCITGSPEKRLCVQAIEEIL